MKKNPAPKTTNNSHTKSSNLKDPKKRKLLIIGLVVMCLAILLPIISLTIHRYTTLDEFGYDISDQQTSEPSNFMVTAPRVMDCGNDDLCFAVISDSHIEQDDAITGTTGHYSSIPEENFVKVAGILDNTTLSDGKTHLDFVMSTGDNVNDLYCPWVGGCRQGTRAVIVDKYLKLVSDNYINTPYYFALGNHDNRYLDVPWPVHYTKTRDYANWLWQGSFATNAPKPVITPQPIMIDWATDESKPAGSYYYFKNKGFNIIVLDSSHQTPENILDDMSNDYNDGLHFGDDQLEWLYSVLLNNSEPTMIFWHSQQILNGKKNYKAPSPAISEPLTLHLNYLDILAKFDNQIKAIFFGHEHKFNIFEGESGFLGKINLYETGTTACAKAVSTNSYYLVLANAKQGTVTINNKDQITLNKGCPIPGN